MRIRPVFGVLALIIGLALCGEGLWLLLRPAEYRATAVIEIEPDIVSGNSNYVSYGGGDFYLTDLKVVGSHMLLSKAIRSLDLNDKWGKRYRTQLGTDETIEILRRHLLLTARRETNASGFLFNISVSDADPDEAAEIANAVVDAYREYRIDQHRNQMEAGIEKLETDYRDEEIQIQILQSNFDRLRLQSNITADPLSDGDLKTSYPAIFEAQQSLHDKMKLHKLLETRIQADKADAVVPHSPLVTIISPAVSPKNPIGLSRWWGAAFLFGGMAVSGIGLYALRAGRNGI